MNPPLFVLNLERSRERREYMTKMLEKKGIVGTIIKAVDGAALCYTDLEEKGIYADSYAHEKFSRTLSLNEIACALSHLSIYERLVNENIQSCVICEDDVNLVPNFKERVASILNELPDDWELVYFWYRTKEIERLSNSICSFPSRSHIPGGAVCYMLKKSGARKLIEEAFPIHYPSDSLIGRGYRWGVKTYGTVPHLARLTLQFPSTIRKSRAVTSVMRKLFNLWNSH